MSHSGESSCARCKDRGWVLKLGKLGPRTIECPACLGKIRVEDLSEGQRKA